MVYDVVVIGGGQAGLSMGYYLKQTALSFIILDKNERAGDVWRKRYDSLVLFTPRQYSSLPGLKLDGDQEGFPTKDEIADYLERYGDRFHLPIQFKCEVHRVQKNHDTFLIHTNESTIQAKRIVIASGPFQTPRIPSFAKDLPNDVVQLHSSEYKNRTQLNDGPVLVVGGGNSGAQIAVELSEFHQTYLSIGQRIRFLPLVFASKSIFWWFEKLGILRADSRSFIGKKIQKGGDPIFGYELREKMKTNAVKIVRRTKAIEQRLVQLEDMSTIMVGNVIWATGFIQDYSWINIPDLLDSNGKVKHRRGITDIDGLYFLGLPWQHRRGSALLLGVGDDAEYLFKHINRV